MVGDKRVAIHQPSSTRAILTPTRTVLPQLAQQPREARAAS